mmetsp:Transcript_86977/g.186333  ORF Transcript_86977/g.186333 Transcript_86977/m.186333 type:complete len:231 (+) Transcript_86977:473-1165(+)
MVMLLYAPPWTVMLCGVSSSRATPSKASLRSSRPSPSECRAKPRRPREASPPPRSVAPKTMAPAPSPKRMQVVQSPQSTHLESASAPMTRARWYVPLCRNCEAVTRPKRNPAQAAVRSNATAFLAPILAATPQASPKRSSGEEVARMMRSISCARQPALRNAFCAALTARPTTPPSSLSEVAVSTWREPIPQRALIHSSDLSTKSRRSVFVIRVSGTAQPMPSGTARRRP